MKKIKSSIIAVIFSTLILFGCDSNYFNITVQGTVMDSISNVPVVHANVRITCWVYNTKRWVSEEVTQIVSTDENGIFKTSFDKGEAIDISVSAENYLTRQESKTLKNSKVKFALFLERRY